MSGKEYLQQIKKIDTQIKNKNVEQEQSRKLGLDVSVIEIQKKRLAEKRQEIIKTIERLPEAEYDVLHKVYVQYKTLQEVAADRDICRRLVDSIHGSALKRLESIINASE